MVIGKSAEGESGANAHLCVFILVFLLVILRNFGL